MKTLFIHRSVGNNFIKDSDFYKLLEESGFTGEFADYDNNTGILRDKFGAKKLGLKFPNDNTTPADYVELFSTNGAPSYKELHDLVMSYDRIMIKSCYPNSNIKNGEELEKIKGYYRAIAKYFTDCKKELIILTSPPLRPTSTSKENAARAKELASWLRRENFGNYVSVFDFFSLLSDDDGCLKKDYRRLIWLDNHPNKRAAKDIAPRFVEAITQ